MSGGEIFQLGAIAVAGTFCALVLRRQTPELALVLALVTGALLLWRSREALETVLSLFKELADLAGLSQEIVIPLIKTVGIALLVRIASQLCRDGGMGTGAAFLELAGSLAALVTVAPLLRAVLELVGELL
ncbi:MAG: stage III sporulation AC/AD family protein [Clostridiales bacterium]|nr:stage III sporulation AC/AD family protein [Clostridiales bacterium]